MGRPRGSVAAELERPDGERPHLVGLVLRDGVAPLRTAPRRQPGRRRRWHLDSVARLGRLHVVVGVVGVVVMVAAVVVVMAFNAPPAAPAAAGTAATPAFAHRDSCD